jgi:hypothetical protein
MRPSLEDLNKLKDVPFEKWPSHRVRLSAVSANADGIVRSGILQDRRYFTLKHFDNFTRSEFVWGDQFFTR